MAELKLPTKKRAPLAVTPGVTIIYSKIKVGKSTIVSKLPDALILDFEKGTLALEVMSMQVSKIADIYKIAQMIKDAGYPYKYIIADTLSSLEEICLPEAERRYAKSPEGKDWFLTSIDDPTKLHPKSGKAKYQSILNLGYGKGYGYLQDVFGEVISIFEKMAPKVILLAHSTITIEVKNDVETQRLDLMLQKKTKFIATFKADAVGYLYRENEKCYLDFSASKDGGGRFRYLEKEPILISEYIEDEKGNETLVTYWDKVYAPKNNKPETVKPAIQKAK